MTISTSECLILALLLVAYSYVSYRTTKALKRSYSAGLFRNFANIPVVHLLLLFGAAPFLIIEKLLSIRENSPGRRRALDKAEYIGNNKTKVFHGAECEFREVMAYKKRVAFKTLEDAKAKGYKPCANCKPGL